MEKMILPDTLYLPIAEKKPLPLEIKGHHVLLLAVNEDDLIGELDSLGADDLAALTVGSDATVEQLAAQVFEKDFSGPVVIAPAGVPIAHLLHDLEQQLPWLQ